MGEFLDVGAGAEGPVTGSGNDHGADRIVALDGVEMGHEAADQGVIQGVHLIRPVEGQDRHAMALVVEHGIVGHCEVLSD